MVEIGFGRGEFLRQHAAAAPSAPHLGVEFSCKRALKLARRIAKAGDPNIRLICARGEDVLDAGIAPETVRTFWINFPDPWPKLRHHRRRLVQAPFVHQLATRLLPGGELQIATDDVPYAQHIDQLLRGEPLLENALPAPYLPEIPGRPVTAYEAMWRAEGRPLHFFGYRRRVQ